MQFAGVAVLVDGNKGQRGKTMWKKTGFAHWTHEPSGIVIEKTANPTAARLWYVQGDGPLYQSACERGCGGGGFSTLRAAKQAVEDAFVAATDKGERP